MTRRVIIVLFDGCYLLDFGGPGHSTPGCVSPIRFEAQAQVA